VKRKKRGLVVGGIANWTVFEGKSLDTIAVALGKTTIAV